MNLGTVLRRRRQELDLRQREVAESAGITEDYLSLVERDQRTPSLELVERLASVLSVPVAYLFFEAEPMDPNLSAETRALVADARSVAAALLRRLDALQRQEAKK